MRVQYRALQQSESKPKRVQVDAAEFEELQARVKRLKIENPYNRSRPQYLDYVE